jgi:hypothetical protein
MPKEGKSSIIHKKMEKKIYKWRIIMFSRVEIYFHFGDLGMRKIRKKLFYANVLKGFNGVC